MCPMDKGTLEMLLRRGPGAENRTPHVLDEKMQGQDTWAEDVAAWKMYSVCVDVGACASFCDVGRTTAHLLPGPPRGQVFNCHKM